MCQSIQTILFNPPLRDCPEAEEPVVKCLQGPAAAEDEALAQAFVFQAAKPITHRDGRLAGVPVHVGLGPCLSKTKVPLEMADRLLVAVPASLKTEVHQDAMAAPEGIMKLLDEQGRGAVDFEVHHHLLTPQGPAFIENCMSEKPAPLAGMPISADELEMVTGIGFVGTRQGEPEMLLLLGELLGSGRFDQAQIVHPEDSALALLKSARLSIGGGGNQKAEEFRQRFDLQFVAFGKGNSAGGPERGGDATGFVPVQLKQRFRGTPFGTPGFEQRLRRLAAEPGCGPGE